LTALENKLAKFLLHGAASVRNSSFLSSGRKAARVTRGLLCPSLPGLLQQGPTASPCLQRSTFWVQTLLVTQMEKLFHDVL